MVRIDIIWAVLKLEAVVAHTSVFQQLAWNDDLVFFCTNCHKNTFVGSFNIIPIDAAQEDFFFIFGYKILHKNKSIRKTYLSFLLSWWDWKF